MNADNINPNEPVVVDEPVIKQPVSRVIKDSQPQRISKHSASKKNFDHAKPAKSAPVDRSDVSKSVTKSLSNHERMVAKQAKKMGITVDEYTAIAAERLARGKDAEGLGPIEFGIIFKNRGD